MRFRVIMSVIAKKTIAFGVTLLGVALLATSSVFAQSPSENFPELIVRLSDTAPTTFKQRLLSSAAKRDDPLLNGIRSSDAVFSNATVRPKAQGNPRGSISALTLVLRDSSVLAAVRDRLRQRAEVEYVHPNVEYSLDAAASGTRRGKRSLPDPILGPVEDDSWFASASGRWSPTSDLRLRGRYRVERGAGAFLSSGEVGARWRTSDLLAVRLDLTASQQIEEFRIGEGMLAGGTASVEIRPLDGVRLDTGVSVYRQYFDNRPSAVDWNQLRGWSTLRLDLGGDPALEGR